MSKMIKEMKELENKYVIDEAFTSACAVRRCIEIAKKYKKKNKGKCVWKKHSDITFICPHTENEWITSRGKLKYCYECGKKIKVVEGDDTNG